VRRDHRPRAPNPCLTSAPLWISTAT
jgi:hypothetical protein